MTIINEVTLPGMIVISGDKRLSTSDSVSDEQIKLVPIGKYGVGTLTGSVRFIDKESRHAVFDGFDLIKEFFKDEVVTSTTIDAFVCHLIKEFKEFRDANKLDSIDGYINVIAYVRAGDNVFQEWRKLTLTGGELSVENHVSKPCDDSGLNAFGDLDIVRLVMNQHHCVAGYRDIPGIEKMIINKRQCPFGSVSLDEAIEFCRDLTAMCSNVAQALGAGATISENCDIAVIDEDGFRWEQGGPDNVSAR